MLKHLALLLLFCPLLSLGQSFPKPLNFGIYRGNVGVSPIISLLAADTNKVIAVTVKPQVGSGFVDPQPTVIRMGLNLVFRFAITTTLPELSRYELTIDGQTRFAGIITTNKDLTGTPPSLAGISLAGSTSQTYTVSGIGSSGYLINHNKANRLVRSTFFREDTGQPDALWRIVIENDNRIRVTGPPGETFSGRVTLEFISQPISN